MKIFKIPSKYEQDQYFSFIWDLLTRSYLHNSKSETYIGIDHSGFSHNYYTHILNMRYYIEDVGETVKLIGDL